MCINKIDIWGTKRLVGCGFFDLSGKTAILHKWVVEKLAKLIYGVRKVFLSGRFLYYA